MKKYIFSFAVAALAFGAKAQSDLTLYNFNAIPQSLHVNPAYPQQTKVWVGLPVLSGVHVHYHNSGFALIDLLERGTNLDSNRNKLIRSLDDNSQLTLNQTYELLGIGFKTGKGFVTLGGYQSVDFRMDYPGDLLRFVNFGNVSGNTTGDSLHTNFNLNTFNMETVVRTNFYVGYQHKFMKDRLILGARVKYIIGQQNSWVQRMQADIESNNTSFNVNTDILVRTSGTASFIDGADLDDPLSLAMPNNNGIGLDFGGYFKLNDHWNFSASVLDLGSITWRDNNRDYISKGSYSFEGIEVDYSDENPGSGGEYVLDSIKKAFDFQEVDGQAYTKPLMTRFFASANYQFSDKHAVGVLYHGRKWGDEFFSDYSFNYQGRWSRTFQFIASYSIVNGTYNNLGAGFDLKLGAVQLYVISDNILDAIMYENLQTTNLRFGINFTFYGRKNKNIVPEDDGRVRLVEPVQTDETPAQEETESDNQ